MTAAAMARRLRLKRHPEGGWYRETWRAAGRIPRSVLAASHGGARPFGTSILYLLAAGQRSRLHRVASDETWYWHDGGALELHEISPAGTARRTLLGPGRTYQRTVPARTWFAARPAARARWALCGCAVAPGFAFADLEFADGAALARRHPRLRALIGALA